MYCRRVDANVLSTQHVTSRDPTEKDCKEALQLAWAARTTLSTSRMSATEMMRRVGGSGQC